MEWLLRNFISKNNSSISSTERHRSKKLAKGSKRKIRKENKRYERIKVLLILAKL